MISEFGQRSLVHDWGPGCSHRLDEIRHKDWSTRCVDPEILEAPVCKHSQAFTACGLREDSILEAADQKCDETWPSIFFLLYCEAENVQESVLVTTRRQPTVHDPSVRLSYIS